MRVSLFLAFTLALCVPNAYAWCDDDARVAAFAQSWRALEPVRGIGSSLTLGEAQCVREKLVRALVPHLGPVAGYKLALTNREVQQKFGHGSPIRGVLLQRMLLTERAAPLSARYGARPIVEADLLVEVGDETINEARTQLDVLKSLVRVYPFIELADLVVAEGEPINGAVITAINAGARAGIAGKPVAVEATRDFADALGAMRVIVTDGAGKELAAAPGSAILGHPLNAVLWLLEDLARSGIRLKRGDRLSLGAFSPPIPSRPGLELTVTYSGLPGSPRVSVRLE